MNHKKGIQLNQAFGAVLTLVLVAVLVIIAIVIFGSLSTSFGGTSTVTVTNESGGYINITGYTLAGTSDCGFASPSITAAFNATGGDGTAIPAGNYTLSSAGVITNATVSTWTDANFSYTYTWGSTACTASENMTIEFANYTSLIGLVGTIIFLGLVIGVLVASFVIGKKEQGV